MTEYASTIMSQVINESSNAASEGRDGWSLGDAVASLSFRELGSH